jgi:hypothetical protein
MKEWKSTKAEDVPGKASRGVAPGKRALTDALSEPIQRKAIPGAERRTDVQAVPVQRMATDATRPAAQVFATALQKDLVGYAYPWGRLWADGDPLGPLGTTLVEIGRPAVPALQALLDDTTPRDSYLGSEEATDMTIRHYRVKDFAAFYLARITGVELPWQPDLAKRDQAITNLRVKL